MYKTHRTHITLDMKMSDLINENYSLLLLLEHLEIDFAVGDKTVSRVCQENHINESVFLAIGNLYNGFYPERGDLSLIDDITVIIRFLRNSHRFYKEDKYPEIKKYLTKLHDNHKTEDIILIERFFDEYFEEVLEHLKYEEQVAFPYFCELVEPEIRKNSSNFSAKEYLEHHSDIETKLTDLKNLMLKHIELKSDLSIRRKLLYSLFELEFDLNIHSMIEEMILLPLITIIEKQRLNG